MTCERCREEADSIIMSRLNRQMICLECHDKERKYPRYEEAAAAELAEVQRGNYNYPGLLDGQDLGEWDKE